MPDLWTCVYCNGTNDGGTSCPRCGASRQIEDSLPAGDHSWMDPTTGYLCTVRHDPELGFWCGYVLVPDTHPIISTGEGQDPPVHGGITWRDHRFPGGERLRGQYVLGFDCAHAWDLVPGLKYHAPDATWKDASYVANECRLLAAGLAAMDCH